MRIRHLGLAHPDSLDWLWEHWGTTWTPRRAEDLAVAPPLRPWARTPPATASGPPTGRPGPRCAASARAALRAADCDVIIEEKASGADRSRPELARLLTRLRRGDTLVVVRIDRPARSLGHLLEVLEYLRRIGAAFRSLGDPIDTSGPSGTPILQILGAVAEFERSLIRERTRAGVAAARQRGRVPGNPRLRAGDPEAIRRIRDARAEPIWTRSSPPPPIGFRPCANCDRSPHLVGGGARVECARRCRPRRCR